MIDTNEKRYKFSIIRDGEFHFSKQVLEGKARQLCQSGMGKPPNKARSLTEEEEVLWEAEKFGSKTPEALISSMWWLLTQFFGLRDRQEHHAMKMEDFQLCKNDEGMELVQFTESPTKTREGGLQSKNRDFQSRMFSVGEERCPFALFKQTTKHAMVGSFLPQYQNKPKTEWQHLVQNSTNGRKHY